MRQYIKLFMVLLFLSCIEKGITQEKKLIDKNATAETKNLFRNLDRLAENHTLFGHQCATEYGHGWIGDTNRSDVKSVTGSHPAVIGVDIMDFTIGTEADMAAAREKIRKNVVETYNRGGVTTVSWHFNNPVSGGRYRWYDTVSLPAVKYIIPGGEAHGKYKEMLGDIAKWANSLKGADGNPVPVIFRPFHEMDAGWFWWGAGHCTVEEFVSLWRYTVNYLRDTLSVHNFIYAYSPSGMFLTEEKFLERYPGDEFVDLIGVDHYGDMGHGGAKPDLPLATQRLRIVSDYAKKAGKLAAFAEAGIESIPNPVWWTEMLLEVIKAEGLKLSYVLVWRNDSKSLKHFYAPYPGHPSVPDFIKFYNDPFTLFEKDLEGIYK